MKLYRIWSNLSEDMALTQNSVSYIDSDRISKFCMGKVYYYTFQIANNKGSDQTAKMSRLVYAIVVHMQESQVFSSQGPKYEPSHIKWFPMEQITSKDSD